MAGLDEYLKRPNTPIPNDHLELLNSGAEISPNEVLDRKAINQLFNEGYLQSENGFYRDPSGSSYVAVLTQMPQVSIDMINWWFWWHAAAGERYQIWYPEMHFDIDADFQGKYHDDNLSYAERLHLSTHLVTEDVGMGRDEILIDFMSPVDFGFNEKLLNPEQITIICARVGAPDKGVWATEMCHFVRKTDNGVEMRSRFWIGHDIYRMGGIARGLINRIVNLPPVKRTIIPKSIGINMFHHCSQEYHNLTEILPSVYEEYG